MDPGFGPRGEVLCGGRRHGHSGPREVGEGRAWMVPAIRAACEHEDRGQRSRRGSRSRQAHDQAAAARMGFRIACVVCYMGVCEPRTRFAGHAAEEYERYPFACAGKVVVLWQRSYSQARDWERSVGSWSVARQEVLGSKLPRRWLLLRAASCLRCWCWGARSAGRLGPGAVGGSLIGMQRLSSSSQHSCGCERSGPRRAALACESEADSGPRS